MKKNPAKFVFVNPFFDFFVLLDLRISFASKIRDEISQSIVLRSVACFFFLVISLFSVFHEASFAFWSVVL